MGTIIIPTCEHCDFASDAFTAADTGKWHFCSKIFDKVDRNSDFIDEVAQVRGDFGCILFKGKQQWSTESLEL